MEDQPVAVIEKARRLEQLLQRVAPDEPLQPVCAELDLAVDAKRLAQLRVKYEAGGSTWEALTDGRYGHPIKAHSALKEWLYTRKRQDKDLTASELVVEVQSQFGVELSAGHINYLLRKVELTRPPGRRSSQSTAEEELAAPNPTPQILDNAGLFFPGDRKARDGHHRGSGDEPGNRSPAVSGRESDDVPAGGGQ